MQLSNLTNRKIGGYTTFGSVWRQGEQVNSDFVLQNLEGNQIPMQSKVLAWWPDGSMKWVSHTADSNKMGNSVTLMTKELVGSSEKPDDLQIKETAAGYEICTGPLSLTIPKQGGGNNENLAENIYLNKKLITPRIYPVFQLERRTNIEGSPNLDQKTGKTEDGIRLIGYNRKVREYYGSVESVVLEEEGPLQAVFCIRGNHMICEEVHMPYVIRLYLGAGSPEIRIVHTFLYDGEEERDFLKGMGIRFEAVLSGLPCNRHVQFGADGNVFHEAAMMLMSNYPKLSSDVLMQQLEGLLVDYEVDSDVARAATALPIWDRYLMFQSSADHLVIKKQTKPECSKLTCQQGTHGLGIMAVSGSNGSLVLGSRDFWQKYPSGLEVTNLSKENTQCTLWFYSPEAEAFDFRHYDTRSYPMTCYEGFEEVGASAVGIGVTSECSVLFQEGIPSAAFVLEYGERIQKPPVYVGTPEYYYEKKAFGYFSLPQKESKAEEWLEQQLEKAFDFYKQEIEGRQWYGLFDYGDVMHTYDPVRHNWKYDIGGYAWQNTELVPTYWLWLYFLRTGREDVYTIAEAMSRHCSEVDVYHFGPYKGLGSRHNVSHWGCSCKEPRIAMAGHHRFLFYLTGDRRIGDIFEEVKDADHAMVNLPHSNEIMPDGTVMTGVRSGPDWSSFVSNWMTHYERTLEVEYRVKIETGIHDIASTPFGFASGPDYYYETEKAHLIYRGEIENTPNQHLQICMGGPQIWWEVADFLSDDTLNRLLAELGGFYFLSKEDKIHITEGKISRRPFSWPMFATGIAAYSAMYYQDKERAKQTWRLLLQNLLENGGPDGFHPVVYAHKSDGSSQLEIPWISTNYVSQWCLNVIMCLEFIREWLPDVYEEFMEL